MVVLWLRDRKVSRFFIITEPTIKRFLTFVKSYKNPLFQFCRTTINVISKTSSQLTDSLVLKIVLDKYLYTRHKEVKTNGCILKR